MSRVNIQFDKQGRPIATENFVYLKTLETIQDEKLRKIIQSMNALIRPVTRVVFQDIKSCIGTCKIMIDSFEQLGYKAELMPVVVEVWNKKLQNMIKKMHRSGQITSLGDFVQWQKKHAKEYLKSGAHLVTIGEPGPENVGHYIVHLPEHKLVLDATLDQANRPHKNLIIDSMMLATLDDSFLQGKSLITKVGNVKLVYHKAPHTAYQTSVDWVNPDGRLNYVVEEVVKNIKFVMDKY